MVLQLGVLGVAEVLQEHQAVGEVVGVAREDRVDHRELAAGVRGGGDVGHRLGALEHRRFELGHLGLDLGHEIGDVLELFLLGVVVLDDVFERGVALVDVGLDLLGGGLRRGLTRGQDGRRGRQEHGGRQGGGHSPGTHQ